jgi:hypothetical protein
MHTEFVRKPEGKKLPWRHIDLGIILKWILEKWGVRMWTGFILLKIGYSGRLL